MTYSLSPCGDCGKELPILGGGPAYAYGPVHEASWAETSHWKCQKCRDKHERKTRKMSTGRDPRRVPQW